MGSKLNSILQKLWANVLKNRHHLFITVRAPSAISWVWVGGSTGNFSKIPRGTTISQVLLQYMTDLLVFMVGKQIYKRQESTFLLYPFHYLPLMGGRADSMLLSHRDREKGGCFPHHCLGPSLPLTSSQVKCGFLLQLYCQGSRLRQHIKKMHSLNN